MTTRLTEIWVGIFVAAGLAALFMLAMKVSNLSSYSDDAGYEIEARFEDISGLKVRSPVTMAGVRIGRVINIGFDKQTFEAVVSMRIESRYNTLPKDTSARILADGLLGSNFVSLEPGGDTETIKAGGKITFTQGSINVVDLLGRFIFSAAETAGAKAPK